VEVKEYILQQKSREDNSNIQQQDITRFTHQCTSACSARPSPAGARLSQEDGSV